MMSKETVLFILSAYYVVSIFVIDVLCAGTAIFTQATFTQFGRQSTAKRLINNGLTLAALAWTCFLLGVIPGAVSPLSDGHRVACILVGVALKVVGQSMQMGGWWRFWLAMRASL